MTWQSINSERPDGATELDLGELGCAKAERDEQYNYWSAICSFNDSGTVRVARNCLTREAAEHEAERWLHRAIDEALRRLPPVAR